MATLSKRITFTIGDHEFHIVEANREKSAVLARVDLVKDGDLIWNHTFDVVSQASRQAAHDAIVDAAPDINNSELGHHLTQLGTAVPNALAPAANRPAGAGKQSTRLIKLVESQEPELFRSRDEEPAITIKRDGVPWTFLIDSGIFTQMMEQWFYEKHQAPLSPQSLKEAQATLAAQARFSGKTIPIFRRAALIEGKVFIDLKAEDGSVVEITPEGWSVTTNYDVRFVRAPGTHPLPAPTQGGSIDLLRRHINVDSDGWALVVGWLVGAVFPEGPYPILALQAEAGSGKSTQARMLVNLVDPCVAPLRTLPRREEDLLIAARNRRVLAIDNISWIAPWLSDALCRLATGGGLSKRQLYSDLGEVVIDVRRPLILTGIGDIVTRADLFDRSLVVHLPSIPQDQRRTEQEVLDAFEADLPAILGALYSAISTALARRDQVNVAELPRMADFAKTVLAAEPALPLAAGEFLRAYKRNQDYAVVLTLEGCPIATYVRRLAEKGEWSGTASDLLQKIRHDTAITTQFGSSYLPRTANWLSSRLKANVANLRRVGVDVHFTHGKERTITIKKIEKVASLPSLPSASEAESTQSTQSTQIPQGPSDG